MGPTTCCGAGAGAAKMHTETGTLGCFHVLLPWPRGLKINSFLGNMRAPVQAGKPRRDVL